MCDNDIYALFTSDEQEETTDRSKQACLGSTKVAKQEALDNIKPAQDLLRISTNPLRVAWWF